MGVRRSIGLADQIRKMVYERANQEPDLKGDDASRIADAVHTVVRRMASGGPALVGPDGLLGLMKAFLGGDEQARLALADAFDESGDNDQASMLRTGQSLHVFHGDRKDHLHNLSDQDIRNRTGEVTYHSELERRAYEAACDDHAWYDFCAYGDSVERVIWSVQEAGDEYEEHE